MKPPTARELLDLGIPAAVLLTMWQRREIDFTQRDLAELLGVRLDSVSRALAKLERHEIIRRAPVPSGPNKYGRARFVYRWSGGPAGLNGLNGGQA